jgi:hypothetical protein
MQLQCPVSVEEDEEWETMGVNHHEFLDDDVTVLLGDEGCHRTTHNQDIMKKKYAIIKKY